MKKLYLIIILFLVPVMLWGAAPVIWYTDIINGPKTGGENNNGCYLTITGTGFGTPSSNLPPATTHVYINSVEVAAYKYLGQMRGRPDSWQLAVQIGGSVTSGAITVTTPDGTATAPENFTVNTGDMFYVATTGDDTTGDGSYANPYRSVKKALNQVSTCTDNADGGDHIIIRGGDYNLVTDAADNGVTNSAWMYLTNPASYGLSSSTTSGRENNHVTVMGYPGEDPIADFETDSNTIRGIRSYAGEQRPYWAFSNITFDLQVGGAFALMFGYCGDCSGSSPITSNCANSRIVNLTITGGMGGCDANGGMNMVSLSAIDNIKLYGINIGNQDSTSGSDCASHVLYVSHRHANADIAYNYIHDNPYGGRCALQLAGDGAEAYYTDNTNVKVRNNLFKNLPGGAILTGRGSYQVTIYDNVFDNCSISPNYGSDINSAWCSVFLRGGGGAAYGDYKLYNNTFYSSTVDDDKCALVQMGYSIENGEYPNSVEAKNNIFYATTSTTAYFSVNNSSFDPSVRCVFSNNKYYGSTVYNKRNAAAYEDYGGGTVITSWDETSSMGDPGMVNPSGGDYTLSTSVPGISLSGVFTTDYYDKIRSAWDIGAFEYETSTPEATRSLNRVNLHRVNMH